MCFLTAGETEVPRLDHPDGQHRRKAAGAIHTDFEKKFIRAEVVNWKTLVDHDGYPGSATRACCGWKARSTSSRTATCW